VTSASWGVVLNCGKIVCQCSLIKAQLKKKKKKKLNPKDIKTLEGRDDKN
jgi:hypothetical protein